MSSAPSLLLLPFLLLLCTHTPHARAQQVTLSIQYGDNVASSIAAYVTSLLRNTSDTHVKVYAPDAAVYTIYADALQVVLSFGDTHTRNVLIQQQELDNMTAEAYIVRSRMINGTLYIVGDGNPSVFEFVDVMLLNTSIGANYAVFRIMELLGFAYFHPLKITIPPTINFNAVQNVSMVEVPFWPVRGWHHHTQHLLELTEVMNGFGPNGTDDQVGWQAMLPYYQSFLFWLVANHQNRVEWLLLYAEEYAEFAMSKVRQQRIAQLVMMAHEVGIVVGADVPIAEEQQHAWRLIQEFGTLEQETEQINEHIDYLMGAGFDFISSENGYSEFTHPNDTRMVAWMNISTAYVEDVYHKKMYIKCHCSTGQYAQDYKNPWTGLPLNFNFLPIYADNRLGIYPHTVQFYRFDDPAPTYGNTNFSYMYDFLTKEIGQREVIYHGETAYWVNYDNDVPLFLPLYADARLYDLRKIAAFEQQSGSKMQGQVNFDSGWEWGYWFQSVITARAAWNPRMEIASQDEALASALYTITSIFGDAGAAIQTLLLRMINSQRNYLIYGLVKGVPPADIVNFNGQAYLEGWDTWSEVGEYEKKTATQPAKFSFLYFRDPLHGDTYWTQISPLLSEMDAEFAAIATALEKLVFSVPVWTQDLFNDIVDASIMTSLRATQVHALYDFAAGYVTKSQQWRADRLKAAVNAMNMAQQVVTRRESQYRIPREIVGAWRSNPTCYDFGYLWTVHSLFFFWRDYEQATAPDLGALIDPCYMNIINPAEVGFGEGLYYNMTQALVNLFDKLHLKDIANCLTAPSQEPHYPLPTKQQ